MRYAHESTKLEDPPPDFCEWWNPTGRDNQSGTDIGGHPDAERVWARKDAGRWVRRTYGANARIGWNSQCYRTEFSRWIALGRPQREDVKMFAAPIEIQKQFWRNCLVSLAAIPLTKKFIA